ncbi:hypothetical protein H6F43_15710 [Leptolyngbya sp. FACHB-36]|uniref:hypothetical protein n=1 Tax=Leptolyngbya sp. FACHB-36 TaxID=2692808 RepID=UPI001680A53E|nr:hypothetical protein [Leptolyngbya sp. FACHB-36]MBD2021626.1 hypothetical protein [Leptolyngbya sp. FACHB-36]
MISALVRSAFETGYLSVESEGLLRQVIDSKSCRSSDLVALRQLYDAVQAGHIRREAHQSIQMPMVQFK